MVNYIGGGEAALTDETTSEDEDDDDDDDDEETEEIDDTGATAGEALLGLAEDDDEETETVEGGAKDPAESEDSEDDVDGDDFALLGLWTFF